MLPNICEIKPNKISTNMKSKFFFFYGAQGTWKTTVASKFPKPLIAAFEIGYQFIGGVHAVPMNSWSDMKDLYRQLKTPEAKATYDTIVFDTISAAYQMAYKYVLNQYGVSSPGEVPYGQGWRAIKEEFGIIKEISKLGYCLVFIAHGKEIEVTNAQTKEVTTKVNIDLDNSALNTVSELVDFVLYVRKETDDKGIEQVYAYSDLPNIETKRRMPEFPTKLLFTYDNIVKGLEDAIAIRKAAGGSVAGDADTVADPRVVKEEDWKVIQSDVISLVRSLQQTPAEPEVIRYVQEIFPNTKLSQTTELDKGKLIAVRDYLLGLQEKIKVVAKA